MFTELDLENWDRKEHFHFFRKFEEPFFGITVEVNCTHAYSFCKKNADSFFLYYLHASLRAANQIEPFRYRIESEKVLVYDIVSAAPTIMRPDGTFGFSVMDFIESFPIFQEKAREEIMYIQGTRGLQANRSAGRAVIHYTTLPWVSFTSFSHARYYSRQDSSPKIAFGKMTEDKGNLKMPVSIHLHHALADGWHAARFFEKFQLFLDETENA